MTLETFIDKNRAELKELIRGVCPNVRPLDDDDIEDWINNDEGLYRWASEEGCFEEYDIEDEETLREAFWDAFPEFAKERNAHKSQNDYRCDLRMAWCDFVESMRRDGSISEELASEVTL